MVKARAAALERHAIRRKVKALLATGDIDDLKNKILENWAVMIVSPNPDVMAFATKEVSKYILPQKRDHQNMPKVEIFCTFIGIKDEDKKDDNEDIKK